MSNDSLTYQKAGVDPEKAANLLSVFSQYQRSRPRDPGLLSGIGPFASCYRLKPLLMQYEDPVLVTCCDGVGTKAKLALDWEKIDGLGADLVAMNVNDLLCTGAKPLLFLDYFASSKLEGEILLTFLKSLQSACEEASCSLVGGETAEMPGIYSGKDFDVAGFAIGLVERENLLGPDRVRVGDVLIGIESSGLHSNGYSLVRRLIEQEKIRGTDKTPFSDETWRDVILKPTHIYVAALKNILPLISSASHITGGGLYENLPRSLPKGTVARVNSAQWPKTPLYQWIAKASGNSEREMLSTFNCGVGMILTCTSQVASEVMSQIQQKGLSCFQLGEIAAGTSTENATVEWV